MTQRTKQQISYNMSRVHSTNSALERKFADALRDRGLVSYTKNDKAIFGKPDFVFKARKVAIFCDSEFWHGYNWESAKEMIKSNKDFSTRWRKRPSGG